MTVKLRPHHLLCMLTFVGKGYSETFIANYKAIAVRLSAGEDILIVEGPDDICRPLLGDGDAHCFGDSVTDRDERAAQAVESLLSVPAGPGASIRPDARFLAAMRDAFKEGEIRNSCERCEWSPLCTTVATAGFEGVLVSAGQMERVVEGRLRQDG